MKTVHAVWKKHDPAEIAEKEMTQSPRKVSSIGLQIYMYDDSRD